MSSFTSGRGEAGRGIELVFTVGDIFAIHCGFVGSDRGYKKGRYPVGERGSELISFRLPPGFYLPCDDYKVYKR